mgnify:CR=1 FL=1
MKIGCLQLTSRLDYQENLEIIGSYLKEARSKQCEAVFLPEVFYSMSNGLRATPHLIEGENEHFQNIEKLARDNKIALLGGSAASQLNGQVINRSYNFNEKGESLGHYDKMNLFIIISQLEMGCCNGRKQQM